LSNDPVALVLFGHNARVWDCCISDQVSHSFHAYEKLNPKKIVSVFLMLF